MIIIGIPAMIRFPIIPNLRRIQGRAADQVSFIAIDVVSLEYNGWVGDEGYRIQILSLIHI